MVLTAGLGHAPAPAVPPPRQAGAAGGRCAARRAYPALAGRGRRAASGAEPASPARHHHRGHRRRRGLRSSASGTPGRSVVLGSAGGPARALPLLDAERFFLVNGDTLTDLDLPALGRAHLASGAAVTLALIPNPDPLHYGGVSVDAGGRGHRLHGAGPLEPRLALHRRAGRRRARLCGVDPDTPSDTFNGVYRRHHRPRPGAIRAFASGAASTTSARRPTTWRRASPWRGRKASTGPLIGAALRHRPGARVSRSVLWDDVRVEDGAVLDECVVADGRPCRRTRASRAGHHAGTGPRAGPG